MSLVILDFEGVEEKRFALLPDGAYKVKITAAESKKTAEGNGYIKWVFEVVEGEYQGILLSTNTSLQPHALFNLKKLLSAVGIDTSGKVKLNPDELIGQVIIVVNSQELYENSPRNRIVDMRASTGTKSTAKVSRPNPSVVETVDPPDDEDDDEEDDDDELGDLDSMSIKELLKFAAENDIEVPRKYRKDQAKLIEYLKEEI